jgi:hypothetical protein
MDSVGNQEISGLPDAKLSDPLPLGLSSHGEVAVASMG